MAEDLSLCWRPDCRLSLAALVAAFVTGMLKPNPPSQTRGRGTRTPATFEHLTPPSTRSRSHLRSSLLPSCPATEKILMASVTLPQPAEAYRGPGRR
eukprot:366551-Chlamydomonas_euryale.AAC.10